MRPESVIWVTVAWPALLGGDAVMKRKQPIQRGVAEAQHRGVSGAAVGEVGLPDATRQRLAELSTLEPDWDSYGALSPSPGSLMMAQSIIMRMVARFGGRGLPSDIMPIADGGIQVEWRSRARELGLNAAPDGSWSYLLIERASGERAYTERYGLSDEEAMSLANSFLSK